MRTFVLLSLPAAALSLEALAVSPPAAPPPASPRFAALVAEARSRVAEIDVAALRGLLAGGEALYLLDVREDAEWRQGRLPRAVHLSKGVLERDIERLTENPRARIVLYCGSGARSLLAADNLRRMGYADVVSLRGGYRAWVESGGEVATGP